MGEWMSFPKGNSQKAARRFFAIRKPERQEAQRFADPEQWIRIAKRPRGNYAICWSYN